MEPGGRPSSRARRNTWIGVAVAEGAIIAATAFVVVAIFRELDCLFDCTAEDEQVGAGAVLLVLGALTLLATGFAIAARLSGWPGGRGVGRGLGATMVLLLVLLVSLPLGFIAPVWAVAVALAGMVAIRPPSPNTHMPRAVAVGILVVLGMLLRAFGLGFSTDVVVTLLALPAIALADEVALRRDETGAS